MQCLVFNLPKALHAATVALCIRLLHLLMHVTLLCDPEG